MKISIQWQAEISNEREQTSVPQSTETGRLRGEEAMHIHRWHLDNTHPVIFLYCLKT